MTKRLLAIVSVAVLSFGIRISATDVTPSFAPNHETAALLQSGEELLSALKAEGVSEEEIIAALKADNAFSANNGVQALLDQAIAQGGEICTTPVTYGMAAAILLGAAIVYYGGPVVVNKVLNPVGGFLQAGWNRVIKKKQL